MMSLLTPSIKASVSSLVHPSSLVKIANVNAGSPSLKLCRSHSPSFLDFAFFGHGEMGHLSMRSLMLTKPAAAYVGE